MKQESWTLTQSQMEEYLNYTKDVVLDELCHEGVIEVDELKHYSKDIMVTLKRPCFISKYFKKSSFEVVISHLSDLSRDRIAKSEMGIK